MIFYNFGEKARRVYESVIRSIGSPASLARFLPASWLEQHEAFQNERNANQATQRENIWLKTQLGEAVSYAQGVVEEAGNAVQRRNYLINDLENCVQEKDGIIAEAEAKAAEAERKLGYAGHWKRDVIEAGHALLQAHAELEAAKSGRAVVFAADHNDRITYASQKALRLLDFKLEDIWKREVYAFLQGTNKKTSGQIKYDVQTKIMRDQPEKVSLPRALLVRSGNRKPVGANITILPIFAGTTYIGSIIRGESREERHERLKREVAERNAAKTAERQEYERELADSREAVANALGWLNRLSSHNI